MFEFILADGLNEFCGEAHLECRLWPHVKMVRISFEEGLSGPSGTEAPSNATLGNTCLCVF